MPFNGERSLGVCFIQRLSKHKLNVSVTQLGGGGGELPPEEKKKKKSNLTGFKTTWGAERVP